MVDPAHGHEFLDAGKVVGNGHTLAIDAEPTAKAPMRMSSRGSMFGLPSGNSSGIPISRSSSNGWSANGPKR